MHYHWQHEQSLIRDIEFYAPHKREEAVIYAPDHANPEQLWKLVDALRARGVAAIPDNEKDHPVLRVSHFESQQSLIDMLAAQGAVSGVPSVAQTEYDNKPSWRPTTLQLGGAMQLFADILVMANAGKRGKEGLGDIMASAKWASAYLMLAVCGAKNPDKQLGYIYKDLKEQFAQLGVNVNPEDAASLGVLAEKSGVLPKIERAIREYPILINSMVQASGGISTIQAGRAQRDYNGNVNWWKIAGGSLTSTGNIVGGALLDPQVLDEVATPEKNISDSQAAAGSVSSEDDHPLFTTDPSAKTVKHDKETPERGFIGRLVDKIRVRPLRLTGGMSFLSNITRIVSGAQEKAKYDRFMGDVSNNFRGGVYEARRNEFFTQVERAGLDLSAKNVLKDSIASAERGLFKTGEARHGFQEYHDLIARRDELRETFSRVAKTKQAATIDYISNAIKMGANLMIASSSSRIDADLKKTKQLDEICGVLAHIVKAQPSEKRDLTLYSVAGILMTQKGIDATEQDIIQRLQEKVTLLERNPWDSGSAKAVTQERPGGIVNSVSTHIAPTLQPAAAPAPALA